MTTMELIEQGIGHNCLSDAYDKGYADAIDDVIRIVRNHHPDIIKMIEQLRNRRNEYRIKRAEANRIEFYWR